MEELILPPLLNGICVDTPFETAIEQVRLGKAGAGSLFWSVDPFTSKIAIVLEPDVDVRQSIEMVPLAMVALSDCLAVLLPPQVAVQFRHNNLVVVNGGVAGSVKAAIAKTSNESEIPVWLVLSIKVGLSRSAADAEPGLQPDVTTLDEEGWEDCTPNKFIETYARHFLSWLAAWNDDGYSGVAKAWKFKDEEQKTPDISKIMKSVSMFESTK